MKMKIIIIILFGTFVICFVPRRSSLILIFRIIIIIISIVWIIVIPWRSTISTFSSDNPFPAVRLFYTQYRPGGFLESDALYRYLLLLTELA